MSETITIARPYAKAIFEHAQHANQCATWSNILNALAMALLTPEARSFIANPGSTKEAHLMLLDAVVAAASKDEQTPAHELLALLVENKRIGLLPDIKVIFDSLRQEAEKTIKVQVQSFSPLSTTQQKALIEQLSQRLKREVELEQSIDSSLLGGAIIHAGDLVIDGSVRGKLNKLANSLAV